MVFIASVEVEPLEGSQMGSGHLGGLVYCFVPADNKRAAKGRLQSALEQDRYRLIRLEFLQDYEDMRWETPEDQNAYDRLAKRAALNNDVVYGPFYTWDGDE